jgi:hypothetical protein
MISNDLFTLTRHSYRIIRFLEVILEWSTRRYSILSKPRILHGICTCSILLAIVIALFLICIIILDTSSTVTQAAFPIIATIVGAVIGNAIQPSRARTPQREPTPIAGEGGAAAAHRDGPPNPHDSPHPHHNLHSRRRHHTLHTLTSNSIEQLKAVEKRYPAPIHFLRPSWVLRFPGNTGSNIALTEVRLGIVDTH